MTDLPIIDAHHHFWDVPANYHPWLCDEPMIPFRYGSYASIRKPFMPEDYFTHSAGHNVVGTVTMEGEWDPSDPVGESLWMQSVHDRYGFPQGHVAQAWLDADDVEEVLAAQSGVPVVRGVRHKPRSAASPREVEPGVPGSMGDPKWRRGYALLSRYGLRFDLQTPWWHLREAVDLAEAFPETLIVLDHAGLPADRSPDGLNGWRAAMRALAEVPGVTVKISGIGLRSRPWRLEDNEPIILDIIEFFGTDRCLFASNFPVDGLCGSFDTIIGGYRAAVADFDVDDQRKLFHDNAKRIYGLSAPVVPELEISEGGGRQNC